VSDDFKHGGIVKGGLPNNDKIPMHHGGYVVSKEQHDACVAMAKEADLVNKMIKVKYPKNSVWLIQDQKTYASIRATHTRLIGEFKHGGIVKGGVTSEGLIDLERSLSRQYNPHLWGSLAFSYDDLKNVDLEKLNKRIMGAANDSSKNGRCLRLLRYLRSFIYSVFSWLRSSRLCKKVKR